MTKFSRQFGIALSQAELDFVDIDLDTDTALYICPYAISIRNDEWSADCGDLVRSFFAEILAQLRAGNQASVTHLLGHLHEPNETRLGQSSGRPRGRGVGENKSQLLGEALRNSRAYHTGLLTDISETELFIFGVGRDTISDLTTNIIRGQLADYTLAQCELHGVPVQNVRSLGPRWNPASRNWEATTYRLPVHDGRPILLVPKSSVRMRLSLDSQEFYNFHMVEFLQAEYLHAGGALIHTFKNGNQTVYKKSVKEIHPFIKDDLADFVREHPEVLERYKEMAGAKGPLENNDLEKGFREDLFAGVLIDRLRAIPAGSENATNYHRLATGICTFLFHPHLITPIKEYEQHEGRKRVDIVFTNAATEGFFQRRMAAPQTRSLSVFVECKNYTRSIQNPELDQLSGRFNLRRGKFGILMCRTMENRERVISGCRDTAIDDRGYMLPLEDADLIQMLEHVQDHNRHLIDPFLEGIFDQVSR
ncbi:hypothetical protein [uncultured Ruegeria sp.]|uniref:hypothetical protein n=1 Tax=uncultured Ruegeria sp. TaxID=259304 RepID=UPI00261D1393|nr:hypothetical protein [uncultured Ruegeria sp.]